MFTKSTTHQRLLSSVVIFSLPFLPFTGFFGRKSNDKDLGESTNQSSFVSTKVDVPYLISPGTDIGMWVWQREYITDPWERILMLDFCRSHGIGRIFVQVNYDQLEPGTYKLADSQDWNELLLMANALNIRVEALDGSGYMAFAPNHESVIARLSAILEFNISQSPNARFSGVHYDIEPYSTPRWKSGEQQEIAVELLELLTKLRRIIVETDPSLTFANDIPFWYDGNEQFFIEFNGVKKYLNEHIQDVSDFIGIMSYRTKVTGENSIEEITRDELAYGAKIGRPVYLSIETVELPDTPQITFYGQSASDVASAVRELSDSFKYSSSFGGVFLHEYRTLRLISDQWDLSEITD